MGALELFTPVRRTVRASVREKFQREIVDYYRVNGRHFPWRRNASPYQILVSEMMLQQTQADRVVEKYRTFLRRFPSFRALAQAQPAAVIQQWQGLGYNRRALYLKQTAELVVKEYRGRLPQDPEILITLPGLGPYASRAVCVFAFGSPEVLIETNIRAVFTHFFFSGDAVPDIELMPFIEATLDASDPARWYNALMDYGAQLKRSNRELTARSVHYKKQSAFAGSFRQKRGQVLALLVDARSCTAMQIVQRLSLTEDEVKKVLSALLADGLIAKRGRSYLLPER